MSDAQPALTRRQIKAAFKRHRGSITRLAEDLHMNRITIHEWLAGKLTSKTISEAAAARAAELIAGETEAA